jgi:hypothetical protein
MEYDNSVLLGCDTVKSCTWIFKFERNTAIFKMKVKSIRILSGYTARVGSDVNCNNDISVEIQKCILAANRRFQTEKASEVPLDLKKH